MPEDMDLTNQNNEGAPKNTNPVNVLREQESPPPEPKTFSEEYVKQLRQEAAANRTKAKEMEEKLKAMPDEITAKVLQALGIETDPQKNLETQLTEAQKKAKEAEEASKQALTKAEQRLIKAEVKAMATEMGLVDSDAALALMDKANVKVGDDDSVTGVKEALEALVQAKPWLKKAETKPPGDPGSGGGGAKQKGDLPTLEEEYEQARKNGNLPLQIALKNKIAAQKRQGG